MARVLVVDDSDSIRSLIVLNLRLEGFDVTEASGGVRALQLATEQPPDCITLDVAMPDLDGLTALSRLRHDPRTADVPVVLVSARAQGGDLAKGMALGAASYVTKPFDPDHLVSVVRSLV